MARIGYCKIGRTMHLDPRKWGVVGGDDEPPLVLQTLARRNPQHEFVLVGFCSGWDTARGDYPGNVVNPWVDMPDTRVALGRANTTDDVYDAFIEGPLARLFHELDALIVWAGQSGTSNTAIPPVGATWGSGERVTPLQSQIRQSAYITLGINAFRARDPRAREEIWLNPDPRNVPKMRDLKWPQRHPILTQYDFTETRKFERYMDASSPEDNGFDAEWEGDHLWRARQRHVYSRLEICGVTPEHIGEQPYAPWDERLRFGLFINEARAYVTNARRPIVREWVLPLEPDFIHGKWGGGHAEELGREITPAPWEDYYPLLRSVRSTFTTPSSGSRWATTKPWQAFATRTVCFFHPLYDAQNHILNDLPPNVRRFLRVTTPEELRDRVDLVNDSESTWRDITDAQYELYRDACEQLTYAQLIEERINQGGSAT